MSRIARTVAVDFPHHITHRGNYRQKVFTEKEDFVNYLKLVNKYASQNALSVLSYCLMPNHVHFIAIPANRESLSKTLNITQMVYAQYVNKKRRISGHLWQGRFYSCVLDENHLYTAVRYVERNPVRAKLVENPWDWKWSSAKQHAYGEKDDLIKLADISKFIGAGNWKEFLNEAVGEDFLEEIRKNTKTGRPVGNTDFVSRLEKMFKRRLSVSRRGRPRKNRDSYLFS